VRKEGKKPVCKLIHRRLTKRGIPRSKDGNRLGLRKRLALAGEVLWRGNQ
jgi:hypothetical protein